MTDREEYKLFVGFIPKSYDVAQLRAMFNLFDGIRSVSLIKDRRTGEPRGSGFVTLDNKAAADAAIAALNNSITLPGCVQPLQVRYALDPAEDDETKLFVGMLPRDIEDSQLRALFEPYGRIKECIVIRNPDGSSQGCAFVRFFSLNAARRAIDGLHGRLLNGFQRDLVVKFADTKGYRNEKRGMSGDDRVSTKSSSSRKKHHAAASPGAPAIRSPPQFAYPAYPGRYDTQSEGPAPHAHRSPGLLFAPRAGASEQIQRLRQHLSAAGALGAQLAMMSRGDAQLPFVQGVFDSLTCIAGEMEARLSSAPPAPFAALPPEHVFPSHVREHSTGSRGSTRGEAPVAAPGTTVRVHNLPLEATDEWLRAAFAPYGPVVSARVEADTTGTPRGSGVVAFASPQYAALAARNAAGASYMGRRLRVEFDA